MKQGLNEYKFFRRWLPSNPNNESNLKEFYTKKYNTPFVTIEKGCETVRNNVIGTNYEVLVIFQEVLQ